MEIESNQNSKAKKRKLKLRERDQERNAERLRIKAEKLKIIQELRSKVDYLVEPNWHMLDLKLKTMKRPIIDREENLPRTIKNLSDLISGSNNDEKDQTLICIGDFGGEE
ncbi:hypothetical protein BY996DRAFT_6509774 [Phakopsora pachyrhizi]|nr:hypothetical protein BY996DRAFT_6509774 [Phakopsora pachyrhizi]